MLSVSYLYLVYSAYSFTFLPHDALALAEEIARDDIVGSVVSALSVPGVCRVCYRWQCSWGCHVNQMAQTVQSVVATWSFHVCSLVLVKAAMLFGLQWQLEVGYVASTPSVLVGVYFDLATVQLCVIFLSSFLQSLVLVGDHLSLIGSLDPLEVSTI